MLPPVGWLRSPTQSGPATSSARRVRRRRHRPRGSATSSASGWCGPPRWPTPRDREPSTRCRVAEGAADELRGRHRPAAPAGRPRTGDGDHPDRLLGAGREVGDRANPAASRRMASVMPVWSSRIAAHPPASPVPGSRRRGDHDRVERAVGRGDAATCSAAPANPAAAASARRRTRPREAERRRRRGGPVGVVGDDEAPARRGGALVRPDGVAVHGPEPGDAAPVAHLRGFGGDEGGRRRDVEELRDRRHVGGAQRLEHVRRHDRRHLGPVREEDVSGAPRENSSLAR